ncbi:MAG: radical SAM protein, partial [Cocleimonas sp.]|nr:radical SAM protein [Cocleimonas sp.]
MPKIRPYIFYGQTQSLCETCLEVVPAKILFQHGNVYYQKRCLEHGVQKTLVSTDIEYFKRCKEYIKPGDMPEKFQTEVSKGCPKDCGLCSDHEQHSCLALFEIIDECNMNCPVCFANSAPGMGNPRSMAQIETMLKTLLDSESEPDLVQVSGGEPTLHPDIIPILKRLKNSPIRHLMLNTNGIRIANDAKFVKQLAEIKQGFEVYLQFDSLQASALKNLRGVDARSTHKKALAQLEKHAISTNLVCAVRKGINDDEIGDIIEYAQQWSCVRGITFQPVQDAGRNDGNKNDYRITLSEIRQKIIDADNPFNDADMIPLPCHPENISIGYGIKIAGVIQPITGLLPKDELLKGAENTITFERSDTLKKAFYKLFSLDACGEQSTDNLQTMLCCLPKIEGSKELKYDNVFRIVIMSFMDKYDF